MVGLNFALNITLIWTPLKEAGLAWSTAIAAIVQVFILLRLTRRYADHIVDQSVLMSWKQSAIVTAIMAAVVVGIELAMPAHLPTWSWAVKELCIVVIAGAMAVVASSIALRM